MQGPGGSLFDGRVVQADTKSDPLRRDIRESDRNRPFSKRRVRPHETGERWLRPNVRGEARPLPGHAAARRSPSRVERSSWPSWLLR